MTLVLTRSDLEHLLDLDAALDALGDGFGHDDRIPVPGQRVRTGLPGPGTATALLPGTLPPIDAYTVKVNAKFPAARPALRGVICLHATADGQLLALLDSATITAWRTGLAAALATHLLADPAARTVGIVGAGAQAALTLRGLGRLRDLDHVVATDLDPGAVGRLARQTPMPVQAVADARKVAATSDIVVLATWSRQPLLGLADVHPGQHLTSLGVDEPGKHELVADLLSAAQTLLVVDDRRLAEQAGVLHGLRPPRPAVTLGAVMRAEHSGRTSADQLTVYAPVGLPWQDLALAWAAYQAARSSGHGRVINLLG
jgi:ornithine cyclodeaminase/alanine dehydrogenase-like protein (mu-crystallin family)